VKTSCCKFQAIDQIWLTGTPLFPVPSSPTSISQQHLAIYVSSHFELCLNQSCNRPLQARFSTARTHDASVSGRLPYHLIQDMITGMSQPALHGTACKVCRRRGRKCDRALPTCVNCEKRGVRCEGYVTRWVGVAARGKFAGKSAPVLEAEAVAPSSKQSHEGIELKPQSHNAVVKSHTLEQDSTRSETVYLTHPDQFDEADIDRLVGHCKTLMLFSRSQELIIPSRRCRRSQ
jgi:hypothetical protein